MEGCSTSRFFNNAMFQQIENFARAIEVQTQLDLYVSQRNANISDKKNKDGTTAALIISKVDAQKLKEAHILIACLDGLSIDDDVAAEIMAHEAMAKFEANHGIHFPRLALDILTDIGSQGGGGDRPYRSQMAVGETQERGWAIYGYPGEKTYIQGIIQAIQEFMKER